MSLFVYIPVHPGYIRVAFRVFFLVALLFIGLVGDKCCNLAVKLRLLRGQHVSLTSMTGWIRGFKSFGMFAQLRALPGGWLGCIMMLTAVIAIAADIAVSASVNLAPYASECVFDRGLVIENSAIAWYPSYSNIAYTWATNAQLISFTNGGYWGIFRKSDNSTNFAANDDDVLGYWRCDATAEPIPFTNTRDVDITDIFINNNLLYSDAMYQNVSAQGTDGTLSVNSSQLVLMSTNSSTGTSTNKIWNVKFAIDLKDSLDPSNGKLLQPYTCNLIKSTNENLIDNIMGTIQTSNLLNSWPRIFQGQLWEDLNAGSPVVDITGVLETVLNSIVMVAGGGNTVSRTSDYLQGCVVESASVPTPLIGLAAFVALLAFWIVCYMFSLWWSIRIARKEYDRTNDGSKVTSKQVLDSVPNGLLDWMSHAAHESNTVQSRPKNSQLGHWLLSTRHHGGRRLGLIQRHQSEQTVPLASPQTPFSDFSSPGYMTSPHVSYMGQKTDYVSVNTREMH